MQQIKRISLIFFLLIPLFLTAQKGSIRGKVYDNGTGETLVGVTVIIVGTTQGTITDLDGEFSMETNTGSYTVQLSYISYNTLSINNVVVKANEVTFLDNLRLKESSLELNEVVISAEIVRTTEMALSTVKRKSAVMMDGISASRMQLIGDATAVEAAKRVTGVSIEGGKYVYVRGLGDRYTKTTLNGVNIPGLDPDRNSLQMDMFPSNLINNMMVLKNFTADLPADFTGGLLDIETKDFPEKKILTYSIGTAFNPQVNLSGDFLTYGGSSTDFLGFDDGTRALPNGARSTRIPTPISGASAEQVNRFVSSFNPELGATRKTSFLDFSGSFTIGNQKELKALESGFNPKLGYIFSASYKSEYRYYTDVQYGEFQRFIDPEVYEMRYATLQEGQMGEHNVLIGLLGGIAYKTQSSKYKIMAMHLQNGESRAGQFDIINDGEAVGQSGYIAASDNLEYNQRMLSNILFNGTHILENQSWEIDWRVSPVLSISNDPDIRKTAFTFSPIDTFFNAGAGGNPARIWRYLNEVNVTSRFDVTKKFAWKEKEGKLKFGAYHTFKDRSYEILFYDIQFFGGQNWTSTDPADVLNPENIFPNKPNSIYYQSGNNNPNPNEYQSNIHNSAVYVSNEFEILPKLKTILGLRLEHYVQRHTGRDQAYASGDLTNGRNLDNDVVLESVNLFPSVNFIYSITEMQNLRASFTQTIARPSFKELSFAQILDPISNRIFNGALFVTSSWDGNLVETNIDNFDFRWELFQERDQLFSISAFYKRFQNPIELVRIPEQQTSTEYQPRNVGDGQLLGLEFEIRKGLDFISPFLYNYSINGNLTLVESEIDMTDTEFNSRKTYEKVGETIEPKRQMAGQSPYVINLGISYSNPDNGLNFGAFYNVKGPTLSIVGAGLFPDIYMEPFHSLNFSINKTFGKDKRSSIDFRISNLLNDRIEEFYQSFQASPQVFTSLNPGRSFSLGYSYRF